MNNFIISKEFVIGQLYHLTVSCFPNFTPEEQKLDWYNEQLGCDFPN